ncbi:MAG: hypothetical protein QM490_06130 [Candidatus Gracilibacteria bacterium]
MILSEKQAVSLIKDNLVLSPEIQSMREDSKTLYALIDGDYFVDELIERIEFIESSKKAIARERYSRDIQDFFERLFQPIDNIWYATGGNKVYDIDDKDVKKEFLHKIANIKDSNTLSNWIQNIATRLKHVDPNGVIFMEYTSKPKDIYPTYKSINSIRAYKKRGQLLDWIIFEPKISKIKSMNVELYRIVDDLNDRTFMKIGEEITLVAKDSFEHPFGEVPAILNSNIDKIGSNYKLSPINSIIGLTKEYSRDQSFLTLYKFTQAIPIHWRYVTYCDDCKGRGKIGNKTCSSCGGTGKMGKNDVTDVVELEVPTGDTQTIAPDIAGFIKPDLETWKQYIEELAIAERKATITFWGTPLNSIETFGGRKTTTEVLFNKQPIENRLNEYADYDEFLEWKMSEWILNFIDKQKNRKESNIVITYGRNYVIEPSDTILKRYEEAKNAQENDVVLDEVFKQYLQATYRTNPVELHKNIMKSKIEPYVHQTIKDIYDVFGEKEAQKKILFGKWWDSLTKDDFLKSKEDLIIEYDKWFNLKINNN